MDFSEVVPNFFFVRNFENTIPLFSLLKIKMASKGDY